MSQEKPEGRSFSGEPPIMELLEGNASNILGIFLCYILGAALGYLWPELVNAAVMADLKEAMETIQKEYRSRPFEPALADFGRSVVVLYIVMALGFIAGVPPVYLILSEGIYQGSIAAHDGAGWWRALPTSLSDTVELYAACIALAWGMKIGLSWFKPEKLRKIRTGFTEANRIFFRLVILLLIAAVVSDFIDIWLFN